jgi:hypothetical protein
MNVQPTNIKDEFLIQSHSNNTIWYRVNLVSKACSCPHYTGRLKYIPGSSCKHYNDLMKHISHIQQMNTNTFSLVENEIKSKGNNVPWEDVETKFGNEIIELMIRLQKLYQPIRGYLGVL